MPKANKDVKRNVLPHSEAKLALFKNYLEHYLRVLSLAAFCTRINLYDIFCGTGIYEDGNIGSPLIARECIKDVHSLMKTLGRPLKPILFTVNDFKEDKVANVRTLLDQKKLPLCTYNYFNENADTMLDIVAKEVNLFPSSQRNLVFIDPYGYSQIHKEKIYGILKNECSELILFLPIMQMYRFTDPALTYTEKKCYENLRNFISSFFPLNHKIHSGSIEDVFEYINAVKEALSFEGKFYTSSHYIEREKGNYYALFFITSSIYGLEKMLEAKWKMDPVKGKGFDQKKRASQIALFQEEFDENDRRKGLEYLARIILEELNASGSLTNNDIYKLSLLHEFRPTHAYIVLRQLLKKDIKARYPNGGNTEGGTGFGINYENYKNNIVKIIFYK